MSLQTNEERKIIAHKRTDVGCKKLFIQHFHYKNKRWTEYRVLINVINMI